MALAGNTAFGGRGLVNLDGPVMVAAALNRLLHRSTTLSIRGEFYRLEEKRYAGSLSMSALGQAEECDMERPDPWPCRSGRKAPT